jgi:hypothetical protein
MRQRNLPQNICNNRRTLDKGRSHLSFQKRLRANRITDADGVLRHSMRRIFFVLVAVVALAGVVAYVGNAFGQTDGETGPIFGGSIPSGYRDWRLISVAHEEGNLNDLRGILGNDIAIANLSWPGHPRTEFNSWSRTQKNTHRPVAGGSPNSTTENPSTWRCTTPASPATRPFKLATLSSPVTPLDT